MGRRQHQASGDGDVQTLVEEIEQTGDRLAAAVEALAFKKAHLKDEVVDKAAEAEHRIAAVAAERLPEVREAASDVAEKVVDTVSRAGETAVTRLRHPTRHPAVIATPEN